MHIVSLLILNQIHKTDIPCTGYATNNPSASVPWATIAAEPSEWLKGWDIDVLITDPSHIVLPHAREIYKHWRQCHKKRSVVVEFIQVLEKDDRESWGSKRKKKEKKVRNPKWVDTDDSEKGKRKQKAKPVDEEESGDDSEVEKVTRNAWDMDIDHGEDSNNDERDKDSHDEAIMDGLEGPSDEEEDTIGKGKKKMMEKAKASNAVDQLQGEEQMSGQKLIGKKRKSLHKDSNDLCM
jgi:hypothetical protein